MPREWESFLELVAEARKTMQFEWLAYCLMPNHFHLILRVWRVPLWSIMQRVKTAWAMRFNRRRERKGHVFGGRFMSRQCETSADIKSVLRYVHLNPVKAGLVEKAEDWRWSSHREYLGSNVEAGLCDKGWMLGLFDQKKIEAHRGYAEFMGVTSPSDFMVSADALCVEGREERMTGESGEFRKAPLDLLAAAVSASLGIPAGLMMSPCRVRQVCAARKVLVQIAVAEGYRGIELARVLGISNQTISKMLRSSSG
ncbi:MAG: transposase [Elusimicrobiota bacterium]